MAVQQIMSQWTWWKRKKEKKKNFWKGLADKYERNCSVADIWISLFLQQWWMRFFSFLCIYLSLVNSLMLHLFSTPYTGFQLEKRTDFKLASPCFQSLNGSAPTYLWDLLHLHTPGKLRSFTDNRVFRIPPFCIKSSGRRSFSYQAPTTWNQLPASIHQASSVSSFKSSSKTFLFLQTSSSAAPPWGSCACQGVCLCVGVCACGTHVFAVCVLELSTFKFMYVLDL